MKTKVVVIDDEKPIRDSLKGVLEDEGFHVFTAEDGQSGLRMVRENIPDLVLLDIWMPGIDGMEVLTRLKDELPQIPVIIMSGHGTIETAVRATKTGAFDFIEKPISLERLILLIHNALNYYRLLTENRYLRGELAQDTVIIAEQQRMQRVLDEIRSLAASDMSVVIVGEEGTGKSFVAKMVHASGDRKSEHFAEFNCALATENRAQVLAEKISFAAEGTLFVAEFDNMTAGEQRLILDARERVKLVFSASRDIPALIAAGKITPAFYYALNPVTISIPPLRERRDDIRPFLLHFAEIFSRRHSRELRFTDQSLEILEKYQWPGNIKELKNFVEHMLITSSSDVVTHRDLPEYIMRNCKLSVLEEQLFRHNLLTEAKKTFEREFIRMKLAEMSGNVKKTSEILGVSRAVLEKKIAVYNLKEYVR